MKLRHGKGYYVCIVLMLAFWALLLYWRDQDHKRRGRFLDEDMADRANEMDGWDYNSNR